VASGRVGAIREIRIVHHVPCGKPKPDPVPWRLNKAANGGGYLANWGVYDLDYLLAVTGWTLRPEVALAQTWPIADHLKHHIAEGSDAETHVSALIRCAGGAVINMSRGEYLATAAYSGWQIIGERGAIRQPVGTGDDYKVEIDGVNPDAGTRTETLWEGAADWDAPHAGPVRDFADALLEGRPPATPLEQARVVQQICDALYHSADTGGCATIG
jgi:predicted dehydrogenase